MHLARCAVVALSLGLLHAATVALPRPSPGGPHVVPAPQSQPARDRIVERAGKGVIRGQVLTADTRDPMARVAVSIETEIRGAKIPSVLTDANGGFEFSGLPATRCHLRAERRGYLTAEYGQRQPADPGKSIDVAEGQTIEGIEVLLTRSSAINGTVVDDLGEPVQGAHITVLKRQVSLGQRRLVPVAPPPWSAASTDDLGSYRIPGLAPGTYYVAAMPPRSDADVDDSVSFAPTFYPATPNVAEAVPVVLKAGEDKPAVNFTLMAARPARVSGLVVDSLGQPVTGAKVRSWLSFADYADSSGVDGPSATTLPNGAFTFDNVRPGSYRLIVDATNTTTGEVEHGETTVNVNGGDLPGVAVATVAKVRARGRVLIDPRADRFPGKQLLVTVSSEVSPVPVSLSQAEAPLWDFDIRGILPGQGRLFSLQGLPPGWIVNSIRWEGRDITNTGLDIAPNQNVTGIEIVLTDHAAHLTGRVVDANGQVVTDYVVLLFPEDRSSWTGSSRSVRTTRPNQNTRFTIRDLRPGAYLAVALDYLADSDARDPDMLASLRPSAMRVVLAEGEKKTVELRLVKPGSEWQEATCRASR